MAEKKTSSDLTPMQMQKADEALHGFEVNILNDTNLLFADIVLGTFSDVLKLASEEQQLLLINTYMVKLLIRNCLKKSWLILNPKVFFTRILQSKNTRVRKK